MVQPVALVQPVAGLSWLIGRAKNQVFTHQGEYTLQSFSGFRCGILALKLAERRYPQGCHR